MRKRATKTLLTSALMQVALAGTGVASAQAAGQDIVRSGSQKAAAGSSEFFTGQVQVEPVWAVNAHVNASGGKVSFEPGARSAWHTHPAGQRLVVLSGTGLTQEWGKPVQEIHAGDVIWCPPGVKHWHGAAPDSAMSHLAVTGVLDGKNVEWMEKVTDAQYTAR